MRPLLGKIMLRMLGALAAENYGDQRRMLKKNNAE